MTKTIKSPMITELVINKIYLIRGQKVMLDRDLAELYAVETRRLNEQVKRNEKRFPKNFMFRLSKKEWHSISSQIAMSSLKHRGKSYLPFAFTEHGILMLANVLKSKRAIEMSVHIIEVFIKMRQMLLTHKDILLQLEKMARKINDHDKEIQVIFQYLKQLLNSPEQPRKRIGFRTNNQN